MKTIKAQLEDKNLIVNKLYNENTRLRGIIERALIWTKNSYNEIELIDILNEANNEPKR